MTFADAYNHVADALKQRAVPPSAVYDLGERVERALEIDPEGRELEHLINALCDEWDSVVLPW